MSTEYANGSNAPHPGTITRNASRLASTTLIAATGVCGFLSLSPVAAHAARANRPCAWQMENARCADVPYIMPVPHPHKHQGRHVHRKHIHKLP